MIQNGQSIPTKRISHRRNHTQAVHHYDSQEDSLNQSRHDHFMERFKNNQNSLRTKFKKYIQQKKNFFPNTFKNLTHSSQQQKKIDNIREIRHEKKKLIQEMNQSMNESRYALAKRQQFQSTYHLLSNKMKRVQRLRRQRKSQVIKMQQTIRSIKQEIKQQKLQFKRKVDKSKHSLLQSRMQKSHQKMSMANSVRMQTEQHERKISEDKSIIFRQNIDKCRTVREDGKKVQLNVSRVYEQKRSKADSLKLQKLFRELAQKEQIKIISARIKKDTTNKLGKIHNKTLDLQQKINQFRKNLGERRLNPPPRLSLPKCIRLRNSQQQFFSTNSELLSRRKGGNYEDEGFEDDQ